MEKGDDIALSPAPQGDILSAELLEDSLEINFERFSSHHIQHLV